MKIFTINKVWEFKIPKELYESKDWELIQAYCDIKLTTMGYFEYYRQCGYLDCKPKYYN